MRNKKMKRSKYLLKTQIAKMKLKMKLKMKVKKSMKKKNT